LEARMTDSQLALLSVVALDAAVAGFVIGGFWLSIALLRSFGNKAGYSLVPLGFARPEGGTLAGVGVGISVGVFAVLLSMVVNPLSVLVLERLGYSTESTLQRPFMQGLADWVRESPGVAVPAIVLVVVIFGPAVEELVFRGVVFNGLYRLGAMVSTRSKAKGGSLSASGRVIFVTSALASSVLFALLHQELVLVPILLILAMFLCALFRRTGSLVPSFVAHATFNSFATSLIILSGLGVLNIPI
jgi:membrane protease YdiL (CAAX protease family)